MGVPSYRPLAGFRRFTVYVPSRSRGNRAPVLWQSFLAHPGRTSREMRLALINVMGLPDTIIVRSYKEDGNLDEAK